MDTKCLDYCLTETERKAFEQDGYFIVENALDTDQVEKLIELTDSLDNAHRVKKEIAAGDRSLFMDFIG